MHGNLLRAADPIFFCNLDIQKHKQVIPAARQEFRAGRKDGTYCLRKHLACNIQKTLLIFLRIVNDTDRILFNGVPLEFSISYFLGNDQVYLLSAAILISIGRMDIKNVLTFRAIYD